MDAAKDIRKEQEAGQAMLDDLRRSGAEFLGRARGILNQGCGRFGPVWCYRAGCILAKHAGMALSFVRIAARERGKHIWMQSGGESGN